MEKRGAAKGESTPRRGEERLAQFGRTLSRLCLCASEGGRELAKRILVHVVRRSEGGGGGIELRLLLRYGRMEDGGAPE